MVQTKTKKERMKHMKRGDGLSLEIRSGESIMIGNSIKIRITKVRKTSEKLIVKVNAPREMEVTGLGLFLEIKSGKSIMIGEDISIRITKLGETSERLMVKIDAPKEMGILGPNLLRKLEKAAEEKNNGEV